MTEQNHDSLIKDISKYCKSIVEKASAGEKIKQAALKVIVMAIAVGGGGATINGGNFWDDNPR